MTDPASLISKATTLVMFVALSISAISAIAKPMPSATVEQALMQPLIVEAAYVRIVGGGKGYFTPPVAQYKVEKVWRNTEGDKVAPGSLLSVPFQFDDGSACLEPADWKFSSNLMPKPGTRHILFIKPIRDSKAPVYATYRGSFGRWDATPAQLTRLEALLREANNDK